MNVARTLVQSFAFAAAIAAASFLPSGCARTDSTTARTDSVLTRSPATTQAPVSPGFINRVWQVSDSTAVQVGAMYVFLSDGTLVLTSPNGTSALGSWKLSPSGLTMVEEGISYETEILALDADKLWLRSNNPGGAVEIHLAPADKPPYTP